MVTTIRKPNPQSVLGTASGDFCLRVAGTRRDGQIVRLAGSKCTIGSGENCTLRLRAVGVRPLHCLILRGLRGIVARSWAPDTLLNDRPFTDAVLALGDRLKFGPIELEVVAADATDNRADAQSVLQPSTALRSESTDPQPERPAAPWVQGEICHATGRTSQEPRGRQATGPQPADGTGSCPGVE